MLLEFQGILGIIWCKFQKIINISLFNFLNYANYD